MAEENVLKRKLLEKQEADRKDYINNMTQIAIDKYEKNTVL